MAFDLGLLGVKENIPRVNFMEYTGLIQAPPKWGKTTIASLYPNSILCAVEKGFKAKRINYIDTSDFSKFIAFIDKLEKNRKAIGKSVQTVAIDTVDRLYPACQDYVVDRYNNLPRTKYKVNSIGDIPHGKGWGMADDEFLKQINRILDMQFTVLFLTHNKIKTVTPENGEPYDVYVPTMPQRCADIIFPLVDFIINGEKTVEMVGDKKVSKRIMRLQGNTMSDSGNRIGNLDEIIKFDTETEAIEKFKEAFKRGIEKNIRESGITKSMDEIESEQKEERETELNEYLDGVKETPKEEDNKSDSGDKPFNPKTATVEEFHPILLNLCIAKKSIDKEAVVAALQGVKGNNPNNITDLDKAKEVYENLMKIKESK